MKKRKLNWEVITVQSFIDSGDISFICAVFVTAVRKSLLEMVVTHLLFPSTHS